MPRECQLVFRSERAAATKGSSKRLTREELVRLFKVARDHNKLHHVALLVGLLHGLRVSEKLAIRGRDICDGKLSIKRLKKSPTSARRLTKLSVTFQPCDGTVASWAKGMCIGYKTINARAETVATTPSFREAFKSQRCLVIHAN